MKFHEQTKTNSTFWDLVGSQQMLSALGLSFLEALCCVQELSLVPARHPPPPRMGAFTGLNRRYQQGVMFSGYFHCALSTSYLKRRLTLSLRKRKPESYQLSRKKGSEVYRRAMAKLPSHLLSSQHFSENQLGLLEMAFRSPTQTEQRLRLLQEGGCGKWVSLLMLVKDASPC